MNILFINDEDLTTRAIGAYGNKIVKTPNLDRLVKKGVLFESAICQSPMCNPSRASFLTGLRPGQTNIFTNQDLMYEVTPDYAEGLAAILQRKKGAKMANIGKLYHGREKNSRYHDFDFLGYCPIPEGYQGKFFQEEKEPCPNRRFEYSADTAIEAELKRRKIIFEKQNKVIAKTDTNWWFDVGIPYTGFYFQVLGDSGIPEECDEDFKKARLAGSLIKEYASRNEQFFLSIGFSKPHTPIVAPKKYTDMYNPQEMVLPKNSPDQDQNMPAAAKRFGAKADIFTGWFDEEFPQFKATEERQKKAIAAYYGAASFIDAQVGYLLNSLEEAGIADNTIVIFFSDHGFHLGEHGLWSKYSVFDEVIRVPLIVYVPGNKTNGSVSKEIVELVDMLPTLCDLWGLEKPAYLQGKSMESLIFDSRTKGKEAAFNVFDMYGVSKKRVKAYSVRTGKYRYTKYGNKGEYGEELYDLRKDKLEQKNVANQEAYVAIKQRMKQLLEQNFSLN